VYSICKGLCVFYMSGPKYILYVRAYIYSICKGLYVFMRPIYRTISLQKIYLRERKGVQKDLYVFMRPIYRTIFLREILTEGKKGREKGPICIHAPHI